jgi:hypothetical protein
MESRDANPDLYVRGDRMKTVPANSKGFMRWRGLEPPRAAKPTRPSTLRVYQFRHQRARISVAGVFFYSRMRKSRTVFSAKTKATTIVTRVRFFSTMCVPP